MRIAIFSDTFLPQVNGVTNTLSKMKEYMDEKGIEYRFFVPGERTEGNYFGSIISFQSMNFFLYPECKLALPSYQRVKINLDKFQPHLIHLVTPFSLGLMGLKYARDHMVPLVTSYHTDFPQYLRYYNLQFFEKAVWHFFRWFHSFSQINFCPSRITLDQLKSNNISNLMIWSRGIDNKVFSPEKRSVAVREQYGLGKEIILLYVGRVAPEKGLDVLFDAAVSLNKKGINYKLLIVGDGPYKKQLEERNLPNVTFLGYKFGAELQMLYASADIFVFPSASETYGNVVLEAMASGLPVVAADAGGVKENLIQMYNGIAFAPGSPEKMAEAISRLIKDEDLRTGLANNARKYSLTKSWNEVFSNLFKNYQELMESSKITRSKYSA